MRVLFRSDHGARFQFRTARAFADSTKRVGERLTVQGRGRQFGYELAGFGKTVRGSFPCEADLTDGRAVRIGAFGRVKEHLDAGKRSEERRVGKEGVGTLRYRGSPDH